LVCFCVCFRTYFQIWVIWKQLKTKWHSFHLLNCTQFVSSISTLIHSNFHQLKCWKSSRILWGSEWCLQSIVIRQELFLNRRKS
jgi:hypothetical protein